MNKATELGNDKDHATAADYLAAGSEQRTLATTHPLLESQEEEEKESFPKTNECDKPPSSTSPLQYKPSEESVVVRKDSLADWGLVACVFFSNFLSAIDFTGFGVFFPYLVEYFDATTAAVGWCSSINGFSQCIVALFASYPIQSFGCRLPSIVGCLLFSLGVSLSCLAPNLTTIYFTYGIIAGSGTGLVTLSTNIIIHQRLTRNRNLASGIGSLGYSFGGMIGSVLVNHLIQSYGWRGTSLILGAMQIQRIPLCMFFRTPERLISRSTHVSGTNQRRTSCQAILKYIKETFNFSILRQARYSVYSVAYLLHIFNVAGYWPHTVNRAIHVGLSSDQGVAAMALISLMSAVTRVPVAFLSNLRKVKASLIFATGMFFAFFSIAVNHIDTGIITTMASSVLFGLHLGCTVPLYSVVTVELMGLVLLPKGLAVLQFSGGFARLASPPLVGWVFDVTRDYNKAFAILGCMAFLSCTLMVAMTFVIIYRQRKSNNNDTEICLSVNGAANPPAANIIVSNQQST